MRRAGRYSRREPTIALINVVFLLLIFFLVAGTIAAPLDGDVRLVDTADLAGAPPADALVLHRDGRLTYRSVAVTAEEFVEAQTVEDAPDVRVAPDREVAATELVALGRDLRVAGAARVIIVTERGLR
ncbi:Biopolymer transport protein (plasmid) [Rhodovulum sp. P5]|uniref:ExbD/TolR family protein n=1 Tax=Rhodovulum sp. P5 TaxID=1564506 RepID=UPI0009C323C9|nr:biopolymer transporter ExbD [Rhodovulum sp. P5]ARE42430.1 Biopolymer transport protein [Rhodovulum sp. P5]